MGGVLPPPLHGEVRLRRKDGEKGRERVRLFTQRKPRNSRNKQQLLPSGLTQIKPPRSNVQSTMSNECPPVDLSITFLDRHNSEGVISSASTQRQPRNTRISNYCISKFSRLQDIKFQPLHTIEANQPTTLKTFN